MRGRLPGLLLLSLAVAGCGLLRWGGPPELQSVASGRHRSDEARALDSARRPLQLLEFLGVRADARVVELWPQEGWLTELLAPYLRDQGHYAAAVYAVNAQTPRVWREAAMAYVQKLARDPDRYNRVELLQLGPPDRWSLGPKSSANLVITYDDVREWRRAGHELRVYRAAFAVLKPGGALGVIEPITDELTEESVIRNARKAGFRLAGRLDPAPGAPAGEPPRMTLRFLKPPARKAG